MNSREKEMLVAALQDLIGYWEPDGVGVSLVPQGPFERSVEILRQLGEDVPRVEDGRPIWPNAEPEDPHWKVTSIAAGLGERIEVVDGGPDDLFRDCHTPAAVAKRYEQFWNELTDCPRGCECHPLVTVLKVVPAAAEDNERTGLCKTQIDPDSL